MEFDFELYFNDQTNNTFNDMAHKRTRVVRIAQPSSTMYFLSFATKALVRCERAQHFYFKFIFQCSTKWFTIYIKPEKEDDVTAKREGKMKRKTRLEEMKRWRKYKSTESEFYMRRSSSSGSMHIYELDLNL